MAVHEPGGRRPRTQMSPRRQGSPKVHPEADDRPPAVVVLTTWVRHGGVVAADPTYLELADGLAASLGEVGDRVLSENELAELHGVSRPTARAALQELERRYLVRRIQGAGTFVSQRIDYVISADAPPSATTTFRRAGHEPWIEIVGTDEIGAPADIALHLGIERGAPLTRVRRRIRLLGIPTAWSTAYVRADLVPGLAERLGADDSLYRVLRDVYRLRPRRRWTRASLDVPPDSTTDALDLDGRPPTWLIEGVDEHDDGPSHCSIEFTRSWMRADVVNVVFELGHPPEVVR